MHYKRTCILWKWHPLLRCTFQDGHSASHLVWPLEVGTLVVFGWVVTSTPGSSDMDLKRDWQLIGKGAAGCQSCGFSSPLSLPGEAEVTGQQRLSQHRWLRRYKLKRWKEFHAMAENLASLLQKCIQMPTLGTYDTFHLGFLKSPHFIC